MLGCVVHGLNEKNLNFMCVIVTPPPPLLLIDIGIQTSN
jgi:hypothetical protein